MKELIGKISVGNAVKYAAKFLQNQPSNAEVLKGTGHTIFPTDISYDRRVPDKTAERYVNGKPGKNGLVNIKDYLKPQSSEKSRRKDAKRSVRLGERNEFADLQNYLKTLEDEFGVQIYQNPDLGKLEANNTRLLGRDEAGDKISLAKFDKILWTMYSKNLDLKYASDFVWALVAHEAGHKLYGNDEVAAQMFAKKKARTQKQYEMACLNDKLIIGAQPASKAA